MVMTGGVAGAEWLMIMDVNGDEFIDDSYAWYISSLWDRVAARCFARLRKSTGEEAREILWS